MNSEYPVLAFVSSTGDGGRDGCVGASVPRVRSHCFWPMSFCLFLTKIHNRVLHPGTYIYQYKTARRAS